MPSIPLISIPEFNGDLVFPFTGDWKSGAKMSSSKSTEKVTANSGIVGVTLLQASSTSRTDILESMWSRRAIVTALEFLKATSGRVTRFWSPSRKRDFVLNGAQAGGYFLYCLPSQLFGTHDDTSLEFPALMVIDPVASRWYARQIIEVTQDGEDNETIQIYGPLPALSAGSFLSLMSLARFSTEDLELVFENTEVARANLTIETLPEETKSATITSAGSEGDVVADDGILAPDA